MAEQIAEKRRKWQEETAKLQPFTATLETVYIGSPKYTLAKFETGEFSSAIPLPVPKDKERGRPQVAPSVECQLGTWLKKQYHQAWPAALTYTNADTDNPPSVLFVGFDPEVFLQIVKVECAKAGQPVPAGMWSNPRNYRDITSLIGASGVDFRAACQQLGLTFIPADWQPHVDPKLDMSILLTLGAKLQLFSMAEVAGSNNQLRHEVARGCTGELAESIA